MPAEHEAKPKHRTHGLYPRGMLWFGCGASPKARVLKAGPHGSSAEEALGKCGSRGL